MRSQSRPLALVALFFFAIAPGNKAFSQQPSKDKAQAEGDADVIISAPMPAVPFPPPGPDLRILNPRISPGKQRGSIFDISLRALEMDIAAKPVKGFPYSAEAVTETVQTLNDGNRIHWKRSTMVYRDNEGRSRCEHQLGAIGGWATGNDQPQVTFISDPVNGFSYVLNPQDHTARKIAHPPLGHKNAAPATAGGPSDIGKEVNVEKRISVGEPKGPIWFENFRTQLDAKHESESLGERMIEGLETVGTRSTLTIPAGRIGNELPIQIVSERWYSPELKIVIFSRHNDPRYGETTYRLNNITRSEPARVLFEVPSDYTIKESERSVPGPRCQKKIIGNR